MVCFPLKLLLENIFSQTCFTLLRFLSDVRIMLSIPFKYIQHFSTTSRKFLRQFEAILKFSTQKHAIFTLFRGYQHSENSVFLT